jgi:hypothetical protein
MRAIALTVSDFATAILENEIILRHIDDGHVFRFPISSDGRIDMQASRIEPNPGARREASAYLFDAHHAALEAYQREQI